MLRITENRENGSTLRLRLDGTVSSEFIEHLTGLVGRYRAQSGAILIIDMAGVSFMSHEAARDLQALRSDHVRIINCSPFIAALLETAKASE